VKYCQHSSIERHAGEDENHLFVKGEEEIKMTSLWSSMILRFAPGTRTKV